MVNFGMVNGVRSLATGFNPGFGVSLRTDPRNALRFCHSRQGLGQVGRVGRVSA